MYYLDSFNDSEAAYLAKYSIFFEEAISNCVDTKNTTCGKVWFKYLCLELPKSACPFFPAVFIPKCINGTLTTTKEEVFSGCFIEAFRFRTTLERVHAIYTYPIILIIYLSSIFYMSEYEQIVKHFNWRFTIWILKARSIKLFTITLICVLNSNLIVSSCCMFLTFIPLLMDMFSLVCILSLFLHVGSIIFYGDTQIRVIKSSLKHFCFMTPILISIIGLIIDMKSKHTNYFQCTTDVFGSFIFFLYITISTGNIIIIFPIYIKIKLKIKDIRRKYEFNNVYRQEYDILGERKEITTRELFRCEYSLSIYMINTIYHSAFNFIMVIILCVQPSSLAYNVVMNLHGARNIIECIIFIVLIWFNKGLKEKMKAWDLWNEELSRDAHNEHNDEDFLMAIQQSTNIKID